MLVWTPLAILLIAVVTVVQEALPNRAEAAKRPPTAIDTHVFPRTYHLWGNEGPPGSLARYDLIVGYAYWNVRALRSRNPRGVFLLNVGLQPTNPNDYGGLAVTSGGFNLWQGGTDRLRGGPKLGSIRAFNPFWDELYNADGSPAQASETWRHGGLNLADPTKRGTAELVAKVFAHAAKLDGLYRNGWDGIFSDNWIYRIGVGWFYGPNLDTNRDGRVDDYDVLRRNWATGLTKVGLLLRSYLPGKIVGGNGNWNVRPGGGDIDFRTYLAAPDAHLKSANFTMLEELQLYAGQADDIISSVREWLGYRDSRGQPRYFAIKHRLTSETDLASMRWGFSLATIAGAYYEAFAGSDNDAFWYDEYDGGEGIRRRNWLGRALSGPQKLPNGVWRRDFQNGTVLNNSTSTAQTVSLSGSYWHLKGTQDPTVNDGAAVSSVTIPQGDGLFLGRQ